MKRQRRAIPADIRPAESDRDILDQYFAEVSRFPLLTADGEKVLARRIRSGDQDAMEELVRRNLRFVVSVAKKYQNRGMPLIDLIGEGNVGLMTRRAKVRSRSGRQVHLVRGLVDSPGDPRRARATGSHGPRSAQSHRRSLARDQGHRDAAREAHARADAAARSRTSPASPPRSSARSSTLNSADVRLDASIGKDSDRALIERFAVEEGRDTGGAAPRAVQVARSRARAPHACRRATPRSSASTSGSRQIASTRSTRSGRCSASPASACASCATARSSACATAPSEMC